MLKYIKYLMVLVFFLVMLTAQAEKWTFTVKSAGKHPWLIEYAALFLCSGPKNCVKISKSFDQMNNTTLKPGQNYTYVANVPNDMEVDIKETNWHIDAISYWKENGKLKMKTCFLDFKNSGVKWLSTVLHKVPDETGCTTMGLMPDAIVILK